VISRPWSRDSSALEFILSRSRSWSRDLKRSWQQHWFLYSFSFLEYYRFSFSKRITMILVLVSVLVTKIALVPRGTHVGRPTHLSVLGRWASDLFPWRVASRHQAYSYPLCSRWYSLSYPRTTARLSWPRRMVRDETVARGGTSYEKLGGRKIFGCKAPEKIFSAAPCTISVCPSPHLLGAHAFFALQLHAVTIMSLKAIAYYYCRLDIVLTRRQIR